ncbi:hypothetical protein ABZS94_35035 [Streptomyces sp. NPDC005500]
MARHTVPAQDYPIPNFTQILALSAEANGATERCDPQLPNSDAELGSGL